MQKIHFKTRIIAFVAFCMQTVDVFPLYYKGPEFAAVCVMTQQNGPVA